MPRVREQCQHCGRWVSILRDGQLRRHNDPFWDEPCGPRPHVDVVRKQSFFDKPIGATVDLPEPRLRSLSLFSGYLGLDLAVSEVLGTELAFVCDNDPAAAKLLAHHHPDVPNLGDITAVDWEALGDVDVISGGFPCTDVSSAGRRAGLTPDTRSGLWSHMARAVAVLRPRLVVIENVRGLLSAKAHSDVERCPWCLGDEQQCAMRALGAVLGDLASLGYDAQWCGLRAADVGAPHGRFRVFIVAADADREDGRGVADASIGQAVERVAAGWSREGSIGSTSDATGESGQQRRVAASGKARGWRALDTASGRSGAPTADSPRDGRHEGRSEPEGVERGPDAALGGERTPANARSPRLEVGRVEPDWDERATAERGDREPAADSDCGGRRWDESDTGRGPVERDAADRNSAASLDWGQYGPAIERWERILGRPAPDPTVTGARGGRVLNPVFVEWMQGLDAGWVTGVPGLSRNDQLRRLGDGVVPQQCAAALRHLLPLLLLQDRSAA